MKLKAVQIACSRDALYALDVDGRVYVWHFGVWDLLSDKISEGLPIGEPKEVSK